MGGKGIIKNGRKRKEGGIEERGGDEGKRRRDKGRRGDERKRRRDGEGEGEMRGRKGGIGEGGGR